MLNFLKKKKEAPAEFSEEKARKKEENKINSLVDQADSFEFKNCYSIVKEVRDAIRCNRSRPSDLDNLEKTKEAYAAYIDALKKPLLMRLQRMEEEKGRQGAEVQNWEA